MRSNVTDVQRVPHVTNESGEGLSGSEAFSAGGLMTVAEVAAVMRVSNMTVYRLIKNGELPAVRVGRNYRLRGSDLERFLEERSVPTGGP
jgi:excisionase family DNA binding protein